MATKYNPSFKEQAVKKALTRREGVTLAAVASTLGIDRSTLSQWVISATKNNAEITHDMTHTTEKSPQDWSLEERSALAHFLTEQKAAPGERVFDTKSVQQKLYIIEKGRVRLTFEDTAVEFSESDSFSEMSILQQSSKLCVATGITDCVFWVLSFAKWEDMKRAAPVISLKLVERIGQKLVNLLNNNFQPHRVLLKAKGGGGSARPPIGF